MRQGLGNRGDYGVDEQDFICWLIYLLFMRPIDNGVICMRAEAYAENGNNSSLKEH